MSPRLFKTILRIAIVAVLLTALSPAFAERDPAPACGSGFATTLARYLRGEPIREKAKELAQSQHEYWTRVFQNCGSGKPLLKCVAGVPFHVLFVERTGGGLFNTGYGLSAPSKAAISISAFEVFKDVVDAHLETQAQRLVDNDNHPGAEYLMSLAARGELHLGLAGELLDDRSMKMIRMSSDHLHELSEWEKNGGNPKDLHRLAQLEALGLFPHPDVFQKFSKLALDVFREEEKYRAGKNEPRILQRLQMRLSAALDHDPTFSYLNSSQKALLRSVYTPSVQITSTQDDLALLSLATGVKADPKFAPLREIALDPAVNPADLIDLALRTQHEPRKIQEKEERWKRTAKGRLPDFARRPDLPEVPGMDFDQHGSGENLKPLHDELSYWELMWNDSRFTDLGTAYLHHELSQREALRECILRIGSLNELYAYRKKQGAPDLKALCRWIAAPDPASRNIALAGPSQMYVEQLERATQLDSKLRLSCELDVAEFLYKIYLSDLSQAEGKKGSEAQADQSLERLLKQCPSQPRPRSCE